MKTMKFSLLLLLIGITAVTANAQKDYKAGIGFRLGPSAGISVKYFLNEKAAIDGIFSSRWHGSILHGLYEIHQDVFSTNNFNFYYGGGAHIGFWNLDGEYHPWFDGTGSHSVFGIDGVVGLEYNFDEIPFGMSIDWKPMLNITDYTGFWMDDIGLTIRYTFR